MYRLRQRSIRNGEILSFLRNKAREENGTITITEYIGKAAEVNIPPTIKGKSITSIGNSAFDKCTSLTSITIPDSVTSIGECAFWACTSLTSITIPDSVTSIGVCAFEGCKSLTSITYKGRQYSLDEIYDAIENQ